MNDILHAIKDGFRTFVRAGEETVTVSFYRFKRKLFRFGMEFVVFLIGLVFILIGGVMVLNKFFALEWILLIAGLLMLNFVLITAKFK